jgi:hypothetical protein
MKCNLRLLGGVPGQGGDLSNIARGLRTVSGSRFGPSNCQKMFRIVMGREIPEYVSSRHLQGLESQRELVPHREVQALDVS